MARLRIRVELNRGGVGVPLYKLASVVQEAQRFFHLLAEDVHIEKNRGEWLAFDFDNGALNFTAEYVGPVSAEQVRAFSAAFDGTTSLRRATIAQFTRIADAIGEDELIGFGLYQSDQENEPSEWRCLSRRDALRIADEIQVLLGASGELDQETHLPAVVDSSAAARLFKERHDRVTSGLDQSSLVREVEASLSKRIAHVEGVVEGHSRSIQDLHDKTVVAETSFKSLLGAVDNFCNQATRQLEQAAPPPQLPHPPPPGGGRNWGPMVVAGILLVGIASATFLFWPSSPAVQNGPPKVASVAPPEPSTPKASEADAPAPAPVEPPKPKVASSDVASRVKREEQKAAAPIAAPDSQPGEPGREIMRLELEAREPVWVAITDANGRKLFERTLEANETRSIELTTAATLRTGNAGGLVLHFNGKPIGPLGPSGKVRVVEFKDGVFRIVPADQG